MGKRMPPKFRRRLAEQGRSIGLRHWRGGIFRGAGTLERVAAWLDLAVQVAGLAAGTAQHVEAVVVGFELFVGYAPILHGEVVVGDGLLAVALLVVALGQEVRGQESPDLSVPVHA